MSASDDGPAQGMEGFVALCREHGIEFYRDPFGVFRHRKTRAVPEPLASELIRRWPLVMRYLERERSSQQD